MLDILLKHFSCTRHPQVGSHVPVTRRVAEGTFGSSVPMHKELKKGTMHRIFRDLHISPDDFGRYV
jgi:HicA toxin of bacterial toxin-antitoxin,